MAVAYGFISEVCSHGHFPFGLPVSPLIVRLDADRETDCVLFRNPVISIVRFAYLIELRPKINDPDIPCERREPGFPALHSLTNSS